MSGIFAAVSGWFGGTPPMTSAVALRPAEIDPYTYLKPEGTGNLYNPTGSDIRQNHSFVDPDFWKDAKNDIKELKQGTYDKTNNVDPDQERYIPPTALTVAGPVRDHANDATPGLAVLAGAVATGAVLKVEDDKRSSIMKDIEIDKTVDSLDFDEIKRIIQEAETCDEAMTGMLQTCIEIDKIPLTDLDKSSSDSLFETLEKHVDDLLTDKRLMCSLQAIDFSKKGLDQKVIYILQSMQKGADKKLGRLLAAVIKRENKSFRDFIKEFNGWQKESGFSKTKSSDEDFIRHRTWVASHLTVMFSGIISSYGKKTSPLCKKIYALINIYFVRKCSVNRAEFLTGGFSRLIGLLGVGAIGYTGA